MQKIYVAITCFFILQTIVSQVNPSTKKVPYTFTKQNITIQDDYAWLENTNSEEVANFVTKQNEFSEDHLKKVTKATNFLFKMKDYDYLSTNSLPVKNRKYYY